MPYEPWQPGLRITANRLLSISPTWSDWTPVWTTSTGNNTPSFGNAVITARWAQSATTVFYALNVQFGTTTNFGAAPGGGDNWRISLPVTASATSLIAGWGEITDSSVGSGSRMAVRVRLSTTTVMEYEMASSRIDGAAISGLGIIDSVSPWTWASGDTLRVWGQYEAAA
ncbi:hypothetical protein ACIG0D_01585 [Streptomyces sp. NPDC052773]|uniref:hypothetical protein n=1 Tax=Streptomyces sp. NPDC052773 TaxID=3365693 RepID=UPI0037CE1381